MGEHELVPEQAAVVAAPGSIAVRAGAGSGKTTVLAERFIRLLRPNARDDAATPEVSRLLAITFTEKAAAEMRIRIRQLVAGKLRTAVDERAHWARVQRDLVGARISTIHAFCARVVREHPIETGIDPDARVLDADEARRYLDARVERHLLALAGARHPGVAPLLRRARGLRGGRQGGAVGACLRALESLARQGRRASEAPGLVARHQARPAEPVQNGIDAIVAAVDAKIAGARRSKGVERLAQGWPEWRVALCRLDAVDAAEFSEVAPALEELAAALAAARVDGPGRELLARRNGRLAGALVEAVASRIMRPEAAAVADLLAALEERVVADKRRDAVLTFDDLVATARDLVLAHPAVRAALARRFDEVLLDECQDTDPAQAELLGAITAAGGPTRFVVGDEKQAIYGFRGADVAVFEDLLRELPRSETLGRNFRSVPSILAFVNAMGEHMLRRPADATLPGVWTAFDAAHVLVPHRGDEGSASAVRLVTVARHLAETAPRKAAGRRELEARILAEVLHDLTTGADAVRAGDVTVLMRSLREVKVYERALARRGVPYHVVGGRGFFQRQEVRDVTSLLAVIADPSDQIALAAVLRSPWVTVPDDVLWALVRDARSLRRGVMAERGDDAREVRRFRERIAALGRLRSRATISEVLVAAIEAFDLDAVLLGQPQGEQQTANLRKVLDLARAFEGGAHGSLPEFVAWLRAREASDADEPEAVLASEHGDVVRLMTIHQAKGLEFPVVVLADLGRALPPDFDVLVMDEEAGVIAAPLVGAGGHAVTPTELRDHRRRQKERARAEHARLFYVACTRAQDRLVLLDGTTKPDRLMRAGGDPEIWGHAVWDVIGRERVWEAGGRAEPTVAEIASGASVVIEPATRWLDDRRLEQGERPAGDPAAGVVDAAAVVEEAMGRVPAAAAVVECTPTEIAEFRACARRWWYGRMLGIADVPRDGRRARVLGGLVHRALERWSAGTRGAAAALLGPSLPLRVGSPAVREELVRDVDGALAWLETERAEGTRLVGCELPFVLALAPDVLVRGRIDALLERDGALVVRDYKYARAPGATERAYAEQVALYGLALARSGRAVAAAELVYLRPAPTVRRVPLPDPAETAATALVAARALGRIRQARIPSGPSRGVESPEECRRLGCGYVRRCWVSDSARDARARTAGA